MIAKRLGVLVVALLLVFGAILATLVAPASVTAAPQHVSALSVVNPAWEQPSITSASGTCTVVDNVNTRNWNVHLSGPSSDFVANNIQWADNAAFSNATTVSLLIAGDNNLPTPASVDTLYVRWTQDPSSWASATWSGDACPTPTPTVTPPANPKILFTEPACGQVDVNVNEDAVKAGWFVDAVLNGQDYFLGNPTPLEVGDNIFPIPAGEYTYQVGIIGRNWTPVDPPIKGVFTVTSCSTPTPTPTATTEPTGTPVPTSHKTPPPTDTAGSSGPADSSTPIVALLICLFFGGIGLAAVEAQRRSVRA
jgi:hypothetical protein